MQFFLYGDTQRGIDLSIGYLRILPSFFSLYIGGECVIASTFVLVSFEFSRDGTSVNPEFLCYL